MIGQKDYKRSVMDRFDMNECRPVGTPGFGKELTVEEAEEELLN